MSLKQEVPPNSVEDVDANDSYNDIAGNNSDETFKVPEEKDQDKIMQEQEAKIKAKYGPLKKPGGSALLQKHFLQKGQKYFDSGDYNMAKAKMNNPKRPLAPKEKLLLQESIGGVIPTPSEIENLRRPSQVASKLLIEPDDGND